MNRELIEQLRRLGDPLISTDYEILEQAARRIEELERTWLSPETYETLMEERKELLADNARLRDAMKEIRDDFDCDNDAHRYGATCRCCLAEKTLADTHEQSLAAYRNKVIEAFVNEFSRHVGGDGEFWLHELQDFAMKEQP